MSQKSQDAIDVLSEVIVDTIDKKLGTAKFDKSQTGVVTAVNGNTYTIAVFGSQYNITSDQIFTVGQSVVVTALQGDMKRLVCSPDNVGTMKTVDSKVKVVGDKLSSFIDKDFADTVNRIDQIKDQVDKSFMSWFYDGEPTTQNTPAKDWTTDDAKRLHIGDLYYDTTSGFSYEWILKNNAYSWKKITNSGIQKALDGASQAQDTADGKRRVFYDTPSPPYDKGDMWTQGNGGDILVCQVSRSITDSYNRADWTVASKYTDDTVANRAEEKADNAQSSADKANNDLASFKTEYDSDLKVTKKMIESRVTATTYSEDMSGLKERVSTAESKITQTEKDITMRVDKSDYTGEKLVSMINIQPESVKIKAKNIELTGAVTIQNGKTVIDSDTINSSITQIDGSKITTGTIDAEKIKAGTITADRLEINGITSDRIKAGQIIQLLWKNESNDSYSAVGEANRMIFESSDDYSEYIFTFRGYKERESFEYDTDSSGKIIPKRIKEYSNRTSVIVPKPIGDSWDKAEYYSATMNFPKLSIVFDLSVNNGNISITNTSYNPDTNVKSAFRSFYIQANEENNKYYTMITFFDAKYSSDGWFGSTGISTNNDLMIPCEIYGIK